MTVRTEKMLRPRLLQRLLLWPSLFASEALCSTTVVEQSGLPGLRQLSEESSSSDYRRSPGTDDGHLLRGSSGPHSAADDGYLLPGTDDVRDLTTAKRATDLRDLTTATCKDCEDTSGTKFESAKFAINTEKPPAICQDDPDALDSEAWHGAEMVSKPINIFPLPVYKDTIHHFFLMP